MTQEKKAFQIVQHLCENGWEAYIAGGAARDILRGEIPNDYDVVTNAAYEDVKKLFKGRKLSIVGVRFKVCIIDGIEVATYRKDAWFDPEKSDGPVKRADTIEEDLARRDFTINAMAFCPYNGDIVDAFGGLSDLKNRVIRFTGNPGDRILEDPCRILRACRFLAKLDGRFDEDTLAALKQHVDLVETHVAPERIRLEIVKTLPYQKPSVFFNALYDIGALRFISPGFFACYGHDGGKFHNETLDTHINIVGDHLPARKPLLRLAGYYHDHGKPAAAKITDGHLSFIGHDKTGADMVEDELWKLKFSVKEITYVTALIRHHMRDLPENASPKTVRKALKALRDDGVDWKDWLLLKIADKKGNLKKTDMTRDQIRDIVLAIYRELHPASGSAILSIQDLAITGKDVMKTLNITTGPKVGDVLNQALDYVMDDPERNTYEKLIRFIKTFGKPPRAGARPAPTPDVA